MPKGEMDFETYSEAGHLWVPPSEKWSEAKGKMLRTPGKWVLPKGAGGQRKKGLGVVGAAAYAEHPTTEVLTLSYYLPSPCAHCNGTGSNPAWGVDEICGWCQGTCEVGVMRRWRPGMPLPQDLFDFLDAGGEIEAHHVMFERLIWEYVCVRKYGWPSHHKWFYQFRCSMAKARVNSLPGPLKELGIVLQVKTQKDADGKRLLDKFSVPRNQTIGDPRTRILPEDDPADAERLYGYCDTDIIAERGASELMEDMTTAELLFWWIDQEINWRGIGVDRAAVHNCIAVLEQAFDRYGAEFREITGGLNHGQGEAVLGWLAGQGVRMYSMDAENVEGALERMAPHPPGGCYKARRVLEIRQLIGSASVKKLYAMDLQACADERLRNLIVHHGARTGRPTGDGVQPLNMPKSGPELVWCGSCARPFRPTLDACPWCQATAVDLKKQEWSAKAADFVLEIIATRSLELVEWFFGDALLCISGCLRGLFVARPGYDLISSDYSAIEAVVTAMLAGETWRIEAFRENKPIYLLSASKITGTPVEVYLAFAKEYGRHHPDRPIGKVSELALGFGGWIAAWRSMEIKEGIKSTLTDDEIKGKILAWRAASPRIVELWGGQTRGTPWNGTQEYYGFEGAAVQAIQYPGMEFEVAGVRFYMRGDALKVRLLSGRELTYREAKLTPSTRQYASKWELSITYMTWNTNPKYGPMGWVAMSTYGPKLAENIIQAIAHDILRHAIINLRAAGYPTVLHVYDEVVTEVPHGCGSVEELERIMAIMPDWAAGWPVRASGGWRGRRYRKD